MIYYVVPARKGSKGLPHKNRLLIEKAGYLRELENVILSTNDEYFHGKGFIIHKRRDDLANDTASMKDVLLSIIDDFKIKHSDTIVLLYLTYPERTKEDIKRGLDFFFENGLRSMLCRKPVKTHPYLCIYESGGQVIKHNLCRRQDYPKVFEISHYLGIFKADEVRVLNNNLYNMYTGFLDIEDKIDVDTEKDLIQYENSIMHTVG